MKCIDKVTLQRYLDLELTAEEKIRIEEHLSDCSACKTRLAALQKRSGDLKGLVQSWSGEEVVVPDFAIGRLRTQEPMSAKKKTNAPGRTVFLRWSVLLSAACVLLGVLFFTPRLFRNQTSGMLVVEKQWVEVDANQPLENQETILQIVSPDGAVSEISF